MLGMFGFGVSICIPRWFYEDVICFNTVNTRFWAGLGRNKEVTAKG